MSANDPYNQFPGITVTPNTQTITTTGAGTSGLWNYPTQTYPVPYPSQGQLFPNMAPSRPLSTVVPVGDNFMCIRGDYAIRAHGKTESLIDVLEACKNIKYLKENQEIILYKPVWEAIFTYMKGEDAYAGFSPSEFLDRVFAPKEVAGEAK